MGQSPQGPPAASNGPAASGSEDALGFGGQNMEIGVDQVGQGGDDARDLEKPHGPEKVCQGGGQNQQSEQQQCQQALEQDEPETESQWMGEKELRPRGQALQEIGEKEKRSHCAHQGQDGQEQAQQAFQRHAGA